MSTAELIHGNGGFKLIGRNNNNDDDNADIGNLGPYDGSLFALNRNSSQGASLLKRLFLNKYG